VHLLPSLQLDLRQVEAASPPLLRMLAQALYVYAGGGCRLATHRAFDRADCCDTIAARVLGCGCADCCTCTRVCVPAGHKLQLGQEKAGVNVLLSCCCRHSRGEASCKARPPSSHGGSGRSQQRAIAAVEQPAGGVCWRVPSCLSQRPSFRLHVLAAGIGSQRCWLVSMSAGRHHDCDFC